MGKRTADQHAVMNRGWEVADDLAVALRDLLTLGRRGTAFEALRRYEEKRKA